RDRGREPSERRRERLRLVRRDGAGRRAVARRGDAVADAAARAYRRDVTAKGLLCAAVGHRWQTAPHASEPFPVLRCSRCGRRKELDPEATSPIEVKRSAPSAATWRGR